MKVVENSNASSGYSWQLSIPSNGFENLLRINFITILCGTHDAIQLFPTGWDSQSIRARIGDTIYLQGELTIQQIEDLKVKVLPNLDNVSGSINFTDVSKKTNIVEVRKEELYFDAEGFWEVLTRVK